LIALNPSHVRSVDEREPYESRRGVRSERRERMRGVSLLVVLVLLGGLTVGCGEGETVTVTEEERATPSTEPDAQQIEAAAERAARRAIRKERARERARKERERDQQAEAAPAPSGGTIEVPNVVGVDHQLAQDTMQAAGLYVLQEEDCTGQDRVLLWDRNWVVVSQDPAAGTAVGEDATITLCSKKDDE
jgi:hypothetical protein